MQVIETDYIEYKRPDKFYLYCIGDIHIGSLHCAEHDLQRKITEIKDKKNAYWIGMGDYFDAILKDDKRFDIGGLADWVKKDNILEGQRKRLKELLSPIADKCICMLTGNHEESIHLHKQDDITQNLCDDLKVKYGGYSCFVSLRFSRAGCRRAYIIHAWHGSGAAQTDGARLNRLTRLVNDIQADVYLMGHLHAMTTHTPDRLVFRNGKIKSVKLAATITGSWLKAYTQNQPTSYAERSGYKPSRIGCPCVVFDPDEDDFWIES